MRVINYGGYPEAIFSNEIQSDPGRYIKSDIIDKVLLRDLPSLYGIQDIQELNQLFAYLAYNTAQEVTLEGLSQNSGVSKNTIKKYIEYLEAAFLIRVVHRVDRNARRFKRATRFKVYLTNPSMRTALFGPIEAGDEDMGQMAETAIFAQCFHDISNKIYYARFFCVTGSPPAPNSVNLGQYPAFTPHKTPISTTLIHYNTMSSEIFLNIKKSPNLTTYLEITIT